MAKKSKKSGAKKPSKSASKKTSKKASAKKSTAPRKKSPAKATKKSPKIAKKKTKKTIAAKSVSSTSTKKSKTSSAKVAAPKSVAPKKFYAHLSASSNRRKSFTIKAPSLPEEQRQIPMKSLEEDDAIAGEIIRILREALTPSSISLSNHSGDHANHPEARRSGGGHYQLKITSEAFEGLGLKERQMWVSQTLRELFEQNKIHALTMSLRSPSEEPLPKA